MKNLHRISGEFYRGGHESFHQAAGNFTKNVRKRGDDYYRKGRVMIHEGSQSELTACVRGSGFYEVQFAWRKQQACGLV